MERKEFLKNLGMGALMIPILHACSEEEVTPTTTTTTTTTTSGNGTNTGSDACVTSPTETAGPYPLTSSRGSAITRVDITDGKTGIALNMTITIGNVNDSCEPVTNARVDVWHCDKDGYYSGYSNAGYLGTQNNTSEVFCRGIQYTDSNGQAKFTTIYPGWYTGRVTHIHVQIFVDEVLKLTTQIAFPDEVNTAVYTTSLYSAHGQNSSVASNSVDQVFANEGSASDLQYELATVTVNASGGYDLVHDINISL